MKLVENMIVWVIDFFKVRNPNLFALLTVALVAAHAFLTDAINKGVICSDWEKTVTADRYVHVSPGDSLDLNKYLPDSLGGFWANEEDGIILAGEGGINTWVFAAEDGTSVIVATNTCFFNDTSGIVAKILYWLTLVLVALGGLHTSEKKKEILKTRQSK